MVANSNGYAAHTQLICRAKFRFILNDNAAARVGIRAWPISVTGIKPAEGPFTARGYLRVDYD
ncbi:adhesin [Salmonella enterica subsp. enterica]|uniref:Adhesin n=1 Tax=Salmonella enterica I TaxID=59201 RepID=A0A447U811_SALET|nr:adhesin [Salmonella enterica subsp. enterica]